MDTHAARPVRGGIARGDAAGRARMRCVGGEGDLGLSGLFFGLRLRSELVARVITRVLQRSRAAIFCFGGCLSCNPCGLRWLEASLVNAVFKSTPPVNVVNAALLNNAWSKAACIAVFIVFIPCDVV